MEFDIYNWEAHMIRNLIGTGYVSGVTLVIIKAGSIAHKGGGLHVLGLTESEVGHIRGMMISKVNNGTVDIATRDFYWNFLDESKGECDGL